MVTGETIRILGAGALNAVRSNPSFPYRTGHLKWNATYKENLSDGFRIVFNGKLANYIDFLEYGTGPHLIINGFGRGIPIMHPGSKKHVGFISQQAVQRVGTYVASRIGGTFKW